MFTPALIVNAWSWCIQGQIPHHLTVLEEIKVNAQAFQSAAIDESLSLSTECSAALLSIRYSSIFNFITFKILD